MVAQILLPIRRPLLDVRAISAALDQGEDFILGLIQSGKLGWAFDISAPVTHRAFVRVLASSVSDYLTGQRSAVHQLRALQHQLPLVVEAIHAIRQCGLLKLTHIAYFDDRELIFRDYHLPKGAFPFERIHEEVGERLREESAIHQAARNAAQKR